MLIDNENDYVLIGEAADILGVAKETIRRWEKRGLLLCERDENGKRVFRRGDLRPMLIHCYGKTNKAEHHGPYRLDGHIAPDAPRSISTQRARSTVSPRVP